MNKSQLMIMDFAKMLKYLNCYRLLIGIVLVSTNYFTMLNAQLSGGQNEFYSAANNGLVVRTEPSIESVRIKKVQLNDRIQVEKTNFIDTIDNRISNWYKIIGESNQYVFGGYLNKYKLPDTINGILNDYVPKLAESFGELKGLTYSITPLNDDKGIGSITFKSNDKVSVVVSTGFEYSKVEYYFKNISINEFINLFELMKVYSSYEKINLNPTFEKGRFVKFSYSIPDAGMENNEIIQINETDVLIRFEYSL